MGDDGDFGYRPLLAALTDTLAELRAEGFISTDEVQRMSLPIVGRRAADFTAPSAPSGRLAQLTIEHVEVFDADDRFFNHYRIDHDAKVFGAQWASFCRFAVFGVLGDALDSGSTDPRRTVFFDRLEAGVAARLAAAPEQNRIPLAQLVLEKRRRR